MYFCWHFSASCLSMLSFSWSLHCFVLSCTSFVATLSTPFQVAALKEFAFPLAHRLYLLRLWFCVFLFDVASCHSLVDFMGVKLKGRGKEHLMWRGIGFSFRGCQSFSRPLIDTRLGKTRTKKKARQVGRPWAIQRFRAKPLLGKWFNDDQP